MICDWDTARLLIFSSNGEPLIYYSHLTSIAIFLALFGMTFLRLKSWPRVTFRLMALSYVVWLFCDLILWANEIIPNVLFFWTMINLVEPLIFVFAYAFFLQSVEKKPLSLRGRWLMFGALLPTLIMAPIGLSVVGFDYSSCDRNVVEGIAAYYNYFLEALFLGLTIVKTGQLLLSKTYTENRLKLILTALGTSLLLASFLTANFLGTLTGDYVTSQYGHIAVPFFAGFLAYLTIRYASFEPKILLIDTLVVSLGILLLSMIFVQDQSYQLYANMFSFIIMVPLGYALSTGIRREVHTRKRIEELARDLEKSNKQQTILLHFITHQIKGYLTKSRNIFSLAVDGDFGPVSDSLKPMLEEGLRSDTKGITTVQEILNAANIKSGKVTYTKTEFDMDALAREITKDLEPQATQKNLTLQITSVPQQILVHGDKGQITQALRNIIDNSIKYTPSGKVNVSVSKSDSKARFEVIDTGIGITSEDMEKLFTEGGHGKNSQKVNVESTGFGLYIVKNIIEAHDGKVWAESEGEGKGSRFVIELPA